MLHSNGDLQRQEMNMKKKGLIYHMVCARASARVKASARARAREGESRPQFFFFFADGI